MVNLDSHNGASFEEYNNLRDKLSDVSAIYRQKYPNCLPIPMEIIDKESEVTEDQ